MAFHISPDGQARQCKAKNACRYGDDTPHFTTIEDARTAYEAAQGNVFSQERLSKNAYETDATFVYEGTRLRSDVWLYSDGEGSTFGATKASVRLVADNREYRPVHHWGGWSAEINREYKDGSGWGSMKGTRRYETFAELAENIHHRAGLEAKKKTGRELTDEELQDYLRDEKIRYDRLDEEIAAEGR